MSDLNKEALDIWGGLKPMIDQEISSRTQGMVQRRKAKVTTAPSLATNTIGVTEAFGQEIFLPFVSNMISANVGDFVWIEWMYGATNAFVSSYAAVDDKNVSVAGVLDVVPRRCYAPLSNEGWYRVMVFDGSSSWVAGGVAFTVDITLFDWARQATRITLWGVFGSLKFDHEQSVSYVQLFDKIRYMQKDGYGYIDVHYTAVWSGSRYVACHFDVKQTHNATYTPSEFESWWTAINFTPVDPSPSGETQLALYNLTANTEAYSDTTTSGVRTIVDRNGKLVTVTVEAADGISCAQGQYTTVSTLPSWAHPRNTVYPCVDAYGGNNIFAAQITTGGDVKLYPVLSNTSYYRLTCTFVTT